MRCKRLLHAAAQRCTPRALNRLHLATWVLLFNHAVRAQVPASVDIDLVDNPTTDSLEVRVRANGATFDELVTGLTFTIRWPAASPATLGPRNVPCINAIPLTASPMVTNGGFNYRTYNAFSTSLISDECPQLAWTDGQWIKIMRVKVNGLTGCTAFNIVNDAYTTANNRDFYVSLNGMARTGTIEATPDSVGACQVDCLGVPGGAALPGAACDDNDPCTANDAWSPACVCGGTLVDSDADGTCDANDGCPNDPNKIAPGQCGCGTADIDTDGDGTANCNDGCPNDPAKISPGTCGCGFPDTDTDGDGTADCIDACPSDPLKTTPGICGCGTADTDSDGDATPDCVDGCPADPLKIAPGACGCGNADTDSDGDATADCVDGCVNDPNKIAPGLCGCGVPDIDGDGDGTPDCNDACPQDPLKSAPGVCGCGTPDTDADGDQTPDCNDGCPADPAKVAPGACGCGAAEPGSACDDGDQLTINDQVQVDCVCAGTAVDCNDNDECTVDSYDGSQCQNTPLPDSDNDGVCDLVDGCPDDASKTSPGVCGCGVADLDTDGDATADCIDGCPNDPDKVDPGICGCGNTDADSDGDGTADCQDACPADPLKIAPGQCGCGVADTDMDGDGTADCVDDCPAIAGVPGSSCDDGDPSTIDDAVSEQCLCIGVPVNDACADAIVLAVNAPADCPANAVAGNNAAATPDAGNTLCDLNGFLNDVWYTFDAGDNTEVLVTLDHGTMPHWGLAIYAGCSTDPLLCASTPDEPVVVSTTPNTSYLVRVYSALWGGGGGPFTICVSASVGQAIGQNGTLDQSVFPNPSDGHFTIRFEHAPREIVLLRVTDMTGRVAFARSTLAGIDGVIRIDAPLAPGAYSLTVVSDGNERSVRLIVR